MYSVNAVGFVTITNKVGLNLIANPLNTTNNTLGALFPASFPDFTDFLKFDPNIGDFVTSTFFFGSWSDPSVTLNPGEGGFVNTTVEFPLTFVGEVMQGNLTNAFPAGLSIRASQVPQAGAVDALGLVLPDFSDILKWNYAIQDYDTFSYFFGSWAPSTPTLAVAEAAFINSASASEWVRTFSVNN